MKRIIISAGYMGSGSSAITDLVSEYKDCRNDHASFEYVLLHCPGGLFDLEDKLLRGNNAIRSDEALRTFRTTMKQLYDKKYWWVGHYKNVISPQFMKITDDFLSEITQFHFKGYWYYHENADAKMIAKLIIQKPFIILLGKFRHFPKITKYDGSMYFSYVKPEVFYQAAKKYIYQVVDLISRGDENVILDQFLLPFNLHRIDNYFNDDVYAIVVERDPRDVFVLNKYIWGSKNISVPFPLEAEAFCDFYASMRESEIKTESKKVLRIHFEDLIYQYETTISNIEQFLHFTPEEHVQKKNRFKPELSIKNTQLFRNENYQAEIKIIEEKLGKYLYPFPYEVENAVKDTVEFD